MLDYNGLYRLYTIPKFVCIFATACCLCLCLFWVRFHSSIVRCVLRWLTSTKRNNCSQKTGIAPLCRCWRGWYITPEFIQIPMSAKQTHYFPVCCRSVVNFIWINVGFFYGRDLSLCLLFHHRHHIFIRPCPSAYTKDYRRGRRYVVRCCPLSSSIWKLRPSLFLPCITKMEVSRGMSCQA